MSSQPPELPDDFPELRTGPPWIMEEMIAAEPALAEKIAGEASAAESIAAAVRAAAEAGEPVAVVGCGTSEHGAMAVAEQLNQALIEARGRDGVAHARQAFEASLDPRSRGVCLGISHEGETAATVAALEAARHAGATTALVTAAPKRAAAAAADHVLATPKIDRSWCHTVGYLSPIVAGGAIAAALRGNGVEGGALKAHLEAVSALRDQAQRVAGTLNGVARIVAAGSGADRIAARELALKVEEGVRLPAVGRDLETLLHGHLVSSDRDTALVVILVDPRARPRRAARGRQLLLAAREIGLRASAIVAAGADEAWSADLTAAGRVVVPESYAVHPLLGSLAGTAVALQLMTLALVHEAGTNPDLIRREESPYRRAAEAAESSFPSG